MTRKLLNDDTQPTPNRTPNRFRLFLWLFVFVLLVIIALLVTIITVQPGAAGLMRIIDFRQTEQVAQGTVIALQATNDYQQQRSLDLQNTQAALGNFEDRLNQTETQQAVNILTTSTAVALVGAQQATQAAIDYQNTQVALQQIGTDVQLAYEATQAALNSSLATIEANRPPQNITIIDGDFFPGIEIANTLPPSIVWSVTDTGILIAQTDNATILTKQTNFDVIYTLNAWFTANATPTHYDVLLGVVENSGGYVVRIYHDGTAITGASFAPFIYSNLTGEGSLILDENTAISRVDGLAIVTNDISVEIKIEGNQLTAIANGVSLIAAQTPVSLATGAVGVQLKTGAQLQMLQVLP